MESEVYSEVCGNQEVAENDVDNLVVAQPLAVGQRPLVYNYDDVDASEEQWTVDTSETADSTDKPSAYVHVLETVGCNNPSEGHELHNGENFESATGEESDVAKNPEPCLVIDESDADIYRETVKDECEENFHTSLESETTVEMNDPTCVVYENTETVQEGESDLLVVDEEEDMEDQTVSVSDEGVMIVTDDEPCQSIDDGHAELLESDSCAKDEASNIDPLEVSDSCVNMSEVSETVNNEEMDKIEVEAERNTVVAQQRDGRNYQAILLQDWEADGPGSDSVKEETADASDDVIQLEACSVPEKSPCKNINDDNSNDSPPDTEEESSGKSELVEVINVVHTFPHSVQKTRAVTELPQSDRNGNDRVIPYQKDFSSKKISSKDLILAIDLIQRTSTGDTTEMNRDEIIGILEGDQVGDWRKSISSSPNKTGNDLDIDKEVPYFHSTLDPKRVEASTRRGQAKRRVPVRNPKVPHLMDKETERELALKQLATFGDGNKKRKTTQVSKDAPVVAAADLGRALASTPVVGGKKRRQPCYKPVKAEGENPTAVKTYTAKQKSDEDVTTEVETGLQTIAIVNKHLTEGENREDASEPVPKKIVKKRRPRELQQLLGDEGAVTMLYETSQKDAPSGGQPTFQKTKKGLEQKTKFVENAVMRLSGTAAKSLRGKRLKQNDGESSSPDDALFPPTTPGLGQSPALSTPSRSRKKPKPAEASRILYRHSSSESFDGSEGLRRTPSEIAGLDMNSEKIKSASPSPRKVDVTSQRKSSRARKVNAKFSAYVAETLTPKRARKAEDVRTLIKEELADSPPPSVNGDSTDPLEPMKADNAVDPEYRSTPPKERRSSSDDISEICLSRAGGLVEITLTSRNPRIKNSFTTDVLNQLEEGLRAADKDPTCRAILLTTEGSIFCQGIDLSQLEPGSDVNVLINALRSTVLTLAHVEKPVVVGVQGAAIGLGVALLPLCDVVIASEASKFSTPYSRLGQGLEAAASFTFPAIGRALVSELVYKGVELTAGEAYQLGLVSQVVPAELFHTELVQIAHAVAAQSCQGLRIAKSQMTERDRGDILDALDRECTALESAWTSAEWLGAAAELLASGQLTLNK